MPSGVATITSWPAMRGCWQIGIRRSRRLTGSLLSSIETSAKSTLEKLPRFMTAAGSSWPAIATRTVFQKEPVT